MALAIWMTVLSPAGHAFEQSQTCLPVEWERLPPNQWVNLSTCGDSPRKAFHGASALAPDRRTVFFFGADTHEKDYDNSVYRLSLTDLHWSRDYEADSLEDYKVTPQGYPVTSTNRPWAMHTFDGWDYDPAHRSLVLVGTPQHATRAIQLLTNLGALQQPIQPTTWHYDPDRRSWTLIQTDTPHVFAGGFAWDPLKNRFIAHNGHQTYHYDPPHHEWITYEASSVPGYHLRLVYDTFANTFLSLGNNHSSRELWSYSSQSVLWKQVIVGQPPLPANGAAIAYDTHHHVLMYLANDSPTQYDNPSGASATFLYKSQEHLWMKLSVKSPPLFGMNYLIQYDPVTDVFLHFEKTLPSNEYITVWAFRYHP